MIRILASLLFLALAGASQAAQTAFVDAPGDGWLNLRAGPSTANRVLQRMPHGDRVTILARPGRWVKLRHEAGAVGWAHGRYLSGLAPEPVRGDGLRVLTVHAPQAGALNLREGPGTGHRVLMTMAQGSSAELLGRNGDWLFLRHVSGVMGWAHRRYLAEARPVRRAIHPRPFRRHVRDCRDRFGPAYQICRAQQMADRAKRGW